MVPKKLICSADTFFLVALQQCGPPNPRARNFYFDTFEQGVSAYVRHTEQGKKFLEYLVLCGEAKARGGKWYSRWVNWYNKRSV